MLTSAVLLALGALAMSLPPVVLPVPIAAAAIAPLRVNAGGGAYTDKAGAQWVADSNYSGGYSYSTGAAIASTNDPVLYQTERSGQAGGNFSYSYSVPDGTYTVTLKFAEIYWTSVGQRVFNVALNGQQVLTNFDILSQTAANTALDKTFVVIVSGGTLKLDFVTLKDNAKVSAIQIVAGGSAPPPDTVRVHAGGGAYTGGDGGVWQADSGFTGGSTYATTAAITGTSDPKLYQTERFGNFNYSFSVPNGNYNVTLRFAELYWNAAGKRVFNVALNGQQVLTNFDILSQTAANTALDKTFVVTVTGGTLKLDFVTVKDNAKVNAIQIVAGGQTGGGTGLTGQYYTDKSLTNLKLTRVDTTINFNWATGSPDPTIPNTNFSARWTGRVKADTSATFTFWTVSDDGVRLWVNNQPLINNWTDHAPTENSGTIALQAGQWYDVRLEFYQASGGSEISLSYSSPSIAKQIVPTDHLQPATASAPVPSINVISPADGSPNGGTAVSIDGANFVSGTTVTFGGVAAINVNVVNGSSLTATTPAHAAGRVDVVVTNPDGQTGAQVGGYTYGLLPTVFRWNTNRPAPLTLMEAQGAPFNGKLYIFGGYYDGALHATAHSYQYEPAADTWTTLADAPEALTHSPVAVDAQTKTMYLVGGFLGDHPGPSTTHVWKYSIMTNTWSRGPDLPAERGAGAAVLLGRTLYFFGGGTRANGVNVVADHGETWSLDVDNGTSWVARATMPNPRNHLAGEVLGGKIYAVGGQHGVDENAGQQGEVDLYDATTDSWTRGQDLPDPRGHINSSTFVLNNRIIVAGGSVTTSLASADVQEYDAAANAWVKLPSLPGPRKSPVANLIGSQLVSSTGNATSGAVPTADTWTGTLANTWETASAMPASLGEVAGGIIGNMLYLVGQGDKATLSYNVSKGTWSSTSALAARPLFGDHHAAEVVNGKLYLIGGLTSGAGKVQIFDPATNAWTTGADMPFPAGSVATAVINGKIYAAGGIIGSTTTGLAAVYDPTANSWSSLAAMPQAVNHAAAQTDGAKLWVFGGRGGGNVPSNGFDYVQVYDPRNNTWTSSTDAGSKLAPLPQARGGMGKAVYYNGEFYILGGETVSGAGATANHVYDRVDIYSPSTNAWRLGGAMTTARHGIFPLLIAGRVYVEGGGTQSGNSSSTVNEIYNP